MCYLLSHVNACPISHVKLALLQSLQNAPSVVKHQTLLPTVSTVFGELLSAGNADVSNSEFLNLLASSFDATAASDLNDSSKPSWAAFEQVLRLSLQNGEPNS